MHVLFVAPQFPANQKRFVHALSSVGARVTGIGERPADWLDHDLKSVLYGYEQVSNVTDPNVLLDAVKRIQRREWVDRLEATVEAHVMTAARVREATGIPGLSAKTAWLCRDKPSMKECMRSHGIPCAQSSAANSTASVMEFVERVGFPIILKPRDGAGASGTFRAGNAAELMHAIQSSGVDKGADVALEEFVEGHEGFYDTLVVNNRICHSFISHYYPNVLEGMRTRWISPQIVVTNRVDAPGYDEVKAMGQRVVDALNIGTSATHMEWFFGPKGLKFSEIGARPPGVGQWDLYSAANDIDLYREWAMGLVHGTVSQPLSRRFSSGIVAIRPSCDGRITGYDGLDELQSRFGEWVIDTHLPEPGTETQPVEAGFMANAWVRMKHPDYDILREMLDTVGRTLKVNAA